MVESDQPSASNAGTEITEMDELEVVCLRQALELQQFRVRELRQRIRASIAAVEDLPEPTEDDAIRSTLEHVLSDMDELSLGEEAPQ